MIRGQASTVRIVRNLHRALIGATVAAVCATAANAQTFVYRADLSGDEVVPPVTTNALGTAWFVVDVEADTITYQLTFDQLNGNEVAAHIDGYAPPGATGSMVFSLPMGKHKSGTWSYAAADEQSILDGLAYVKIDSDTSPSGELRGQIEQVVSPHVFLATLEGAQEAPPVTTPAMGTAIFTLDPVNDELDYALTFADLTSTETEAHLHGFALAGQNAPVLFDLGTGFHKSGTWLYQPTDEVGLLAGEVYANVHSMTNPSGEIRGQLDLESSNPSPYCTAKVNSQLCVPAITAAGLPSLTGPDDFEIGATELINQSIAALMWSPAADNVPFMNGTLCIDSGSMSLVDAVLTGGNTGAVDCSGLASLSVSQADLAAAALLPGDVVYAQWWYRDSTQIDGTGFGSTDALAITVLQ